MVPEKSILVAACGNPDAGDDSFGPLVARSLRACRLPGVTVLDLGMRPASLLDHLPGPSALFIVDAVHWPGASPGRVIDMDWFDPERPPIINGRNLSTHGLSVADQLELGKSMALLPPVVRLIGLVIEFKGFTRSVSGWVRQGVSGAVQVVQRYASPS